MPHVKGLQTRSSRNVRSNPLDLARLGPEAFAVTLDRCLRYVQDGYAVAAIQEPFREKGRPATHINNATGRARLDDEFQRNERLGLRPAHFFISLGQVNRVPVFSAIHLAIVAPSA